MLFATLVTATLAADESLTPPAARVILHGIAPGAPSAALAALQARADAGDAAAAMVLAEAHYLGLGTPARRERALAWWERAAALGDTSGAYNAGLLHCRDPLTRARGEALLAQAAASGDVLAAFVLGTRHANAGARGSAIPLLRQAARAGYAPAQYNLARLLEPDDAVAATRWYAAAAPTFEPAASALATLERARDDESSTLSAEDASDSTVPAADDNDDARDANAAHNATATAADDDGTSATPVGADPAAGRQWVLAQPPSSFTVQVGAGRDPEALARLLEAHAGDLPAAWFVHHRDSADPYSAVVGSFPDRATATAARDALPAALARNAPWVRGFAAL
ncbi:MAG: SPOR domain-containing protein, partial [Gammaproteobacteria bacterium]